MSNIDERVVKMEFDNKAFEKNAGDTLSTLDKLKEALKFDNVKDSFKNITKAANKVDISNVGENVDVVKAKFSALQVAGYTAISNLTNTMLNFGKNVVGKTFGQIIQGGINRSLNIEQAKFTIEGLGKDFVQLKEDINYAVSGTAYGFDEAAKAASMMAASGIEAGDEMKASLRGISGMAAMTGDSYANIADIFGNIAGKGKLTLQEVNRFATRGINVAAKLAEQFGTTEEAIREMVSKGEISFREFSAAMDEAFGEHATEANKTFTGIVTNMKATLSRIGEAFIHPLIETNEKDILLLQASTYRGIDKQLVSVADHANRAFEAGVNARTSLNKALRESNQLEHFSGEQLKALIDNNKKGFIEASKAIPELSKVSNDELKKLYSTSQVEVEKILSKTPQYADKTREELRAILATGKEQFIEEARMMNRYANMTDDELGEMYDKFSGFQYNLVSVFQAFRRIMQAVETNINKSEFLQIFLERFREASRALTLFFNAIAASMSTVERAGEVWEQYISVVDEDGKTRVISATKLWNKFRKAIGMTEADFTNIKDTLKGVWSIFKLVGDVIHTVFDALVPTTGAIGSFGSVIFLVTGTIGRFITALYDIIDATGLIRNFGSTVHIVFSGIVGVVQFFVNGIVALFTSITSNPVFDEIVNTFIIIGESINQLWYILYAAGKRIFSTFVYPFTKMGDKVDFVGGVVTDVLVVIADALHMFNTALEAATIWITTFISEFIDLDKVLELGNGLASLFSSGLGLDKLESKGANRSTNVFGGLVGGIEGAATKDGNGIIGIVKGFAGNIQAAIQNIDYKKIGNNISKVFKFIADVLLVSFGIVVEAFEAIGNIVKAIDFAGIAEKFRTAIQKFLEAISMMIIAIPSFITGVIDELIANMGSLKPTADALGIALGELIASGIRLIFKAIPLILRIIVNALKEISTRLPGILHEFADEMQSAFGLNLVRGLEKIKKAIKGVSFIQLLEGLNLVELFTFIKLCKKAVNALNGVASLPKALERFILQMKTSLAGLMRAKMIQTYIVSLGMIIGLLYLVSFVPYDKFLNGLSKMIIVAAFLGAFIKVMAKALNSGGSYNPREYIDFVIAVDGFILALTALMVALGWMSKIENMWRGIGGFMAVLIGLIAFMGLMKKLKIDPYAFATLSTAMATFASAMLILSVGIAILSMFSWNKILVSVLALEAVIAGITIAAQFLEGKEGVLKAFATLGPMLLMLSAGLALLSLFDWKSLMASVLAISVVLGVLVGLGAIAGNFPVVSAGLAALSASIAALGAAVLGVGAGVYLFVAALQTLSMMGSDGSMNSLAVAIQKLSEMIPVLFGALGQGIIILVQTLANSAIIIADAFGQIIEAILMKTLSMADMFATVGVTIIMTLLDGILASMYHITVAAVLIVTEFINGIADNMDTIVNSGINLITSFINGIANGIDQNGEVIRASVMHLMGSIINFIIDSLQELLRLIPGVGDDMAKQLDGIKEGVSKIFGDGKVASETKKGLDKTTDEVKKGSKKARDANKKNMDAIVKDSKKSFKESGKAAEELPKAMDKTIGKYATGGKFRKVFNETGKSSIGAFEESFVDNAKPSEGKKAMEKVANGGKDVSMSGSANHMWEGFSKSFLDHNWYGKGAEAAREVNRGFRETVKEHSPSRLWAEYATNLYLGLSNKMKTLSVNFYTAGVNAGKSVNSGFQTTMDMLSSIDLNSIAEPTIRPVMDLSNVKMGVDSINSMMNANQYAIGVAGSIPTKGLLTNRNITFNNTITVDGAQDPRQFVDELVQELEIQARTV